MRVAIAPILKIIIWLAALLVFACSGETTDPPKPGASKAREKSLNMAILPAQDLPERKTGEE